MAIIISPVFLLSKSRKHFVTLSYADDDGRPQAMVLQVDKGHVREFWWALEAKTGRKNLSTRTQRPAKRAKAEVCG